MVPTATSRTQQLGDRIGDIPTDLIYPDPNQPRSLITDQDIQEMADSIKLVGLQERIILRMRSEGGYWLVAGETRWRAYGALQRPTIPAIVRLDLNDEAKAFEVAFVSNVGRKDMDPIDEAEGLQRIFHDAKLGSNMQLARRIKRPLSFVTDRLLLNYLSDDDKAAVRDGSMPLSVAVTKAREIRGRTGTPHATTRSPRPGPAAPALPARGFGSGHDPWRATANRATPKPSADAAPRQALAPPVPEFRTGAEPAAPPESIPPRGQDTDRLRALLLRAVRAGRDSAAAPEPPSDEDIVEGILASEPTDPNRAKRL